MFMPDAARRERSSGERGGWEVERIRLAVVVVLVPIVPRLISAVGAEGAGANAARLGIR